MFKWNPPVELIKILSVILIIGTVVLGALGYFEKIFTFQWSKIAAWICLATFFILTICQIILDKIKEARQAEEFYNQEIIEAFPPRTSKDLLTFFTDDSGNKCIAIKLKYEPIPKSVKLWEGGYDAPPITLAFKEKEVIFRNSAYSSFEEYSQKQGPIYQIRYFPKSK